MSQNDQVESTQQRAFERSAYSIQEFCARNSISHNTYFKLKAQNLGPCEMRFGNLVRISAEAELDWQRARSNPQSPAEIKSRAASEATTKERGRKGGRLAAQSPRHVSKTRKLRAKVSA